PQQPRIESMAEVEIRDIFYNSESNARRSRLRVKAAALGMLVEVEASEVSHIDRQRAIESTRGLGPFADKLIAYDRNRD
ncbi:MAG: hypothetical protein ACREN8_11500, partial [Candidatus Dormibacteraceae bacterium]